MALNKDKYREAILYLCSKLGNEVRGKKKLAKLLYFVDFDLFEKTEKSLTGDVYKAFPMGPFPTAMEDVTTELSKKAVISVSSEPAQGGYHPTEVYRCLRTPDLSVFNEDEKAILDRVILKYGHLNGKQLEDLTHAEAPYIGTQSFEEIPFELAYYRGTDFSQ